MNQVSTAVILDLEKGKSKQSECIAIEQAIKSRHHFELHCTYYIVFGLDKGRWFDFELGRGLRVGALSIIYSLDRGREYVEESGVYLSVSLVVK
jgi:hypothetical protein